MERKSRIRICEAAGCNNTTATSNLAFFRFPKNSQRSQLWKCSIKMKDSNRIYKELCSSHFELKFFTDTFRRRLHCTAIPTIQRIKKKEISKPFRSHQDSTNTKPKDSILHTPCAKVIRQNGSKEDTWMSPPFAYLYTNHVKDDCKLLEEPQKLCSTVISAVHDSVSENKPISSSTKICGPLSPKNATVKKTVNSSVKPSNQCPSAERSHSQCDEVTLLNKKLADVEARLEFANEKLLEARKRLKKKNFIICSLLEEMLMPDD